MNRSIKRMNGKKLVILGGLTLSLVAPTFAFAHAHLTKSVPAKDSTVTELPAHITLTFSEPLETVLSKIEVKDLKTGKVVAEGKPSDDAQGANTLEVTLQKEQGLETTPAEYQVNWKIVAKDSHRMQGTFAFKVVPGKGKGK